MTDLPAALPRTTNKSALETWGWAVFVATSWTWCIGMFLPALMVRDFGFWGWVVFATPNVIGAAAVGFFRYRMPEGDTLLDRHRPAMIAFSAVTVLFHIFFAAWMIQRLIGRWGLALPLAVAAFCYGATNSRRGQMLAPLAALIVSVAAAAVCALTPGGLTLPSATLGSAQSFDLLCLVPGFVVSFLLCPHLDLTLQRARAAAGPDLAPRVFVVGFGVIFLALIFFSLLYAQAILPALDGGEIPAAVRIALGIHISVQAGLTSALHLQEMPMRRVTARAVESSIAMLIIALGVFILSRPLPRWFGLDAGEIVYRCFLGFYGYVFPAYMLIAMVRRRGERPGPGGLPGSATLTLFALAVLAATPFFAWGFLARQAFWALPGIGIILIAPLVLPRKKGGTT